MAKVCGHSVNTHTLHVHYMRLLNLDINQLLHTPCTRTFVLYWKRKLPHTATTEMQTMHYELTDLLKLYKVGRACCRLEADGVIAEVKWEQKQNRSKLWLFAVWSQANVVIFTLVHHWFVLAHCIVVRNANAAWIKRFERQERAEYLNHAEVNGGWLWHQRARFAVITLGNNRKIQS